MTIVEFLLARIAEDEEAVGLPRAWRVLNDRTPLRQTAESVDLRTQLHDPARVLRECEAKRRIVAWFGPANDGDDRETYDVVLHSLAVVYADHPDYDPEWATA